MAKTKKRRSAGGGDNDKLQPLRRALATNRWGDAVRIGGAFRNTPLWDSMCYCFGKKLVALRDANDTESLKTLFHFMDKNVSLKNIGEGKFIWLTQMTKACDDCLKFVVEYKIALMARDYLQSLPKDTAISAYVKRDVHFYFALAALRMGDIEGAIAGYNEVWQMDERLTIRAKTFSNLLFAAQNLDFSDEDLFAMHLVYNKFFADISPYEYDMPRFKAQVAERVHGGGKIRIGYISPDFREHVVIKFICGLFAFYDKEKFEIYAYSTAEREKDTVTEWISERCKKFADISRMTIDEAAKFIHDDGIDILVDFAGHTANNPLPIMAYKPAPIQITGVGYMSTTGLSAVDYIISDKFIEPPEFGGKYLTEKPLYLTSHFSYSFYKDEPPMPGGAPCLKRGFVTFGSFNKYNKFTDEMLLAWRDILRQTKGAKLLLKAFGFDEPDFSQLVKERLARLGYDLDAVIIEGASTNYMSRYLDVDIALDTYPYTGGTTTCDALYMGVPVVSRYGKRRNTRFGLGILGNMGLLSLTADNVEDYVTFAVGLANDTALLDGLHKNLRRMFAQSPVGNARRYVDEMQKKYMEILGFSVV